MGPNDFFPVMKRFSERIQKIRHAPGKIVSVAGNVAYVRVSGSQQIQEAWFANGLVLSPGDDCQLQRSGRDSHWTVVGSFRRPDLGHNELSPVPTADQVATVTTPTATPNVVTVTAFDVTLSSGIDSVDTITSQTITTTKQDGRILVSYTGHISNNDGSIGQLCIMRLNSGSGDVDMCRMSAAALIRVNASFTWVSAALPPGTYTITVKTYKSSASSNVVVTTNNFALVEI